MKPTEKTMGDFLRALDSAAGAPSASQASAIRSAAERSLGFLPADTFDALMDSFRERYALDAGRAVSWLGTVAGIFLGEYDGSPLETGDWRELRDIVAAGAGELDMDLVSAVMSLVLENKAL